MAQENFPENRYKFIGPSIQGRIESDLPLLETLTNPLIYISLGSMLNNAKSFYKNCIAAFENQPYKVIISVGKMIDIDDFGKLPPNIEMYPFVPQLKILEKASLFITHGGMNSVNEALYYGVPMVVMPLTTDQPTIAKQIERLNLGERIDIKDSPTKIRDTSLSVMHNSTIIRQAKNFSSISHAAKGTTFAAEEIERFCKRELQRKKDRGSR